MKPSPNASPDALSSPTPQRQEKGTPLPLRPGRPPPYLEQLRRLQPATANSHLPYLEQLQQRPTVEMERYDMRQAALETLRHSGDTPLRAPLADLLAHTLASGRDMISGREIFWRLRVPPNREACEKRALARVLRSLGWVKVRYGHNAPGQRVWGWRWREWNISQIRVDLKS